jgi:hypothetical protein
MKIPSADDIRNIPQESEDKALVARWRRFTHEAIAKFISGRYASLQNGEVIRFDFPTLRDGGQLNRIWIAHHMEFVTELQSIGYEVKAIEGATKNMFLSIKLPSESHDASQTQTG